MNSFCKIFVVLMAVALSVASGFAPIVAPRAAAVSSSALPMFGGKKKKPAKGGKEDSFLGGKGEKITVREDEDAAMWIEEDKDGKRKPAAGGKGK